MGIAAADRGIECDRANRSEPLVWRHPHALGACVVEDVDGSLWLLFEREGASAWSRRRRWTNGVAMLLPFGPGAGDLLARVGYAVEPAQSPRRDATAEA